MYGMHKKINFVHMLCNERERSMSTQAQVPRARARVVPFQVWYTTTTTTTTQKIFFYINRISFDAQRACCSARLHSCKIIL